MANTTDTKIDHLEWKETESSAVTRIAYDQVNERIYVQFSRGAIYRYDDCDQSVWTDLTDAASVGAYVHRNLAHHNYTEVSAT